MKLFGRLGLIIALTCASVTGTVAQQWGGERSALVLVQPLGFERAEERVDAVGYAEATRSVELFPAVGDLVREVTFSAGDLVEQGELLVQLDNRRQKIALERAKIELADAERTVERLRRTREQGAIPQSQLDDASTIRDLLKVAVDEARTALEDREIRAPFAGYVGITDVEAGDRITPQTLITTLDQRDQLYVDFAAPELALPLLQENASLSVRPWNRQAKAYSAEIVHIDSRILPGSRTIRVRALLNNEEDTFRPGMSFRVSVALQGNSYPVIPEAALMWGAEGAYLWIVEDNKAKRVDVEIKQRLEGRILVSGDLQLGDSLIVEGVQQLREGQQVRVEQTTEIN
ncbi:efflux RND transporter periplasmic adaptor subunit [Pseudidiomarina sp.]|uniref:efflux RND transporter periplasmic adaptor subunit n=1 Tax=Pseudidiomarina sp. TaxID=2081707 RepID=UPI00299F38C5|nr:efflux RND transporter periplasmic adaptor subunit [Pseudidiomarina sp.]MDX1704997.1 efflux RND transporter periplasmic adaptor subunit [Pseudidiomarina sp.]